MKSLYSFFLVLLTTIQVAVGQDYVFKVLANQGTNTFKNANASSWSPIKTGASFKSEDEVKIAEGSYLGLVHSSGRTFEIKTPGTYKINDLANQVNASKTSLAGKYADFVLSKMNAEDEVDVNKQAKKYQNVTGAVERATETAAIKLFMPTTSLVLNNEALIKWKEAEKGSTYVVVFKDLFEEELMTKETNEPYLKVNLSDKLLAGSSLILVSVRVKGNDKVASNHYAIKRLDPKEADKLNKELQALKSELKDETSINTLIIASFYEQNNLFVDALAGYELSIKMSPNVEQFRSAYEDFLMRNNLIN
jgi:hypothetical protein